MKMNQEPGAWNKEPRTKTEAQQKGYCFPVVLLAYNVQPI